jgi:hypothetical protein
MSDPAAVATSYRDRRRAARRMEFGAVKYTLTDMQTSLLREIAAATEPVSILTGRTQTAWALEKRGLVKSTWRGNKQVTGVTADGRYFLKHGKHPREVQQAKERLERDPERAAGAPTDGAELITRLRAASGKITVTDPGPQTRGRWRAAYYDALHHDHVPAHHKMRWAGRQRGDCIFTLVDEEAEKAAQPVPAPTIDVPDTLNRPHRLVRATRAAWGRSQSVADTRDKPDVIPVFVSRAQADRTLRIMQAVLAEAERRGYEAETRTDFHRGEAVHSLVIVIRGQDFPLAVTERKAKVPHEATPQEVRKKERYPWTQFPKFDEEFDGRLVISAPAHSRWSHSYSHSDGARWALESRLGRLLQDLEDLAADTERREQEQKQREAEQRRRWYSILAEARQQQVERHRATVLTEQVQRWRQAAEIRAFCQAARARANSSTPAIEEEWLRWAEAHATSTDPLQSPLQPPPDPPATREALRDLLAGDLHAHPWPYDAKGRWTIAEEKPHAQET